MTEVMNKVKTKSLVSVLMITLALGLTAIIGYSLWQSSSAGLPATAVATPRLVCNQGQTIGDLNNDKKLDANDTKILADVIVRRVLPPVNYCCIDLNRDNRINTADTSILGRIVRGEVTPMGVCNNEPKAINSTYFPQWLFLKIAGGWPVFYTANGLINGSESYVFMSKQTPFIEGLAAQITVGANKHQTVQNIMDWLHQYMESKGLSNDYCNYYTRLSRTAEAILTPIPPNNKACATGCTDWATAFVALARAKGIPASAIDTVSDAWIKDTIAKGCTDTMYGHHVADVYTSTSGLNAGWELVDPTKGHFTVYENNNYSGNILMRFFSLSPDGTEPAFGSGYPYRVFRRGIDAWEMGILGPVVWEKEVAKKYGLPTNSDGTIKKCPQKIIIKSTDYHYGNVNE